MGDSVEVADHMGPTQAQDVRDALNVGRHEPKADQALSAQGSVEALGQGAADREASHGRSRRRRQSELPALESGVGDAVPESEDGETAESTGALVAGDSVLMSDVKALREAYCDHFIKTGELHQGMLAQLTAYALAINGPPKPDRRRAAGHFRKGKPRPVIMPSLRGRGRVKGIENDCRRWRAKARDARADGKDAT